MAQYHKALVAEIQQFAATRQDTSPISTIFFGGGTPSTYPNDLLLDMYGILKTAFHISEQSEVTIEVNPGTVKDEQLTLWKSLGINRLSVGVQSLNDKVLQNLNRMQSAQQVFGLLNKAHHLFENISIDLIIGLPGISEQEWKNLIKEVCTWPITHISIYFLTIHEGTALQIRVKKNDVTLPADDATVDLYVWTVEYLAAHGFEQYEISNFGKNGFRARHNQVYWSKKRYKGFGVGACSFDGERRYQNIKDLFKYMKAIEEGLEHIEFEETLTSEQQFLETIMLGLRQKEGIALDTLLQDVNQLPRNEVIATIDDLIKASYVHKNSHGNIALTPLGLAMENEIIVRLSR